MICAHIKKDTSFFSSKIINFLLGEEDNIPRDNIFVLAGLAVNTLPVTDFMFGNLKIRWAISPKFLSSSIIQEFDYLTGQITLRDNPQIEEFDGLLLSYIFRFNSGQFILLCWEDDVSKVEKNIEIITEEYPYTLLSKDNRATLFRCTNELTYHSFTVIDCNWGHMTTDQITMMRKKAMSPEAAKSTDDMIRECQEQEKRLAEDKKRKK